MTEPTVNKWNRHKALKLDDMMLGQDYAISLNPDDQPDCKDGRMSKIDLWIFVRKHVDILTNRGIRLTLYIESSPTGRIHFHGTMKIVGSWLDYISFVRMLQKEYCYEIDSMNDEPAFPEVKDDRTKWEVYCQKQMNIFLPLFENNLFGYPIEIHSNPNIENGIQKESIPQKGKGKHAKRTKMLTSNR